MVLRLGLGLIKIIVFLVDTTFSGNLSSTPRNSQCMHFTKTNLIKMYRLQKKLNRNNQMVMTSYKVYLFLGTSIFYSYFVGQIARQTCRGFENLDTDRGGDEITKSTQLLQ